MTFAASIIYHMSAKVSLYQNTDGRMDGQMMDE